MSATGQPSKSHPISIVGMGCRFAGGANSPQKLWELLEQGRSAWSKIPASRFNVPGVYHPSGEKIGSSHVKGGNFLDEDVALFDASFFNITTDVASSMDPQHRLMLEVVYEALESAGIPLESIAGSNTSVFSGAMYQDYHDSLHRDPDALPRYSATGNSLTMASNRISHFYDLHGPSVTVDTACSTTLTALHLACQSLNTGESDMAIVAGANIILNSDNFVTMSNLGFLSPDGISYSFDPRANGYGRGEGVAAIILKTLPGALMNQDPVRAIIPATAISQDGKTATITSPSEAEQAKLIRECYAKAGLDLTETSYIEAHGTGTPTGDPLEISAISTAFQGRLVYVGSIKANIGHTEAASGLAGVIKVAMSLEKGLILPNARFLRPNKKLLLEERNLKLPTSVQPWPLTNRFRRASVQNFGFGGSNAHAILEWHDPATSSISKKRGEGRAPPNQDHRRVLVLSAKDEQACRRMAENLRAYIERARNTEVREGDFLDSLAYTLGSRRSALPWKAVLAVDNTSKLIAALRDDLQPRRSSESIRIGWVFTGQGAQWHAMGRELIETFPVFESAILECDDHIQKMGATWKLRDELYRDEATTRVNEAEFSLPLSTAIQIALVRLLWSIGIQPRGITSHSSGEAAAAFAAGALSARSAMGITYLRGVLTAKPKPSRAARAGMMAVGLGRDDANVYIYRILGQGGEESLVIGCVNSQSSVTVSGDLSAIEKLEVLLRADNIFARRLKVTEAFHSNHMLPMTDDFRSSLVGLFTSGDQNHTTSTLATGNVIYSSPMTGELLHSLETLSDPAHWVESMLKPVEFESSLRNMIWNSETRSPSVDVIVEIGPHGALGGPIKQIMQQIALSGDQVGYISCLSRGKNSLDTMYNLIVELTQNGCRLNMDAINFPLGREQAEAKVLHDLPTYPWNHQVRHWREPRRNRALRQRKNPPHSLIGSQEPLSPPFAPIWKHVLRVSDIPWTRDHTVGSNIVFPGAGFISMAIEGLTQVSQPDKINGVSYHLRDVEITQALLLADDPEAETDVRLVLKLCDEKSIGYRGWHEFSVHSISGENDAWIEHCTGLIRLGNDRQAGRPENATQTQDKHQLDSCAYSRKANPKDLYKSLHAVGICYGSLFRNILRIRGSDQRTFSTFAVSDTASTMPHSYEPQHVLHPTTLDSAIQTAYTPLLLKGRKFMSAMVPRRIKSMDIFCGARSLGAGNVLNADAKITEENVRSFSADLTIWDGPNDGIAALRSTNMLVKTQGLQFQSVGGSLADPRQKSEVTSGSCISWEWAPDMELVDNKWLGSKLSADPSPGEQDHIVDLRQCTVHFVQDALEQLTAKEIAQLGGHFRPYYDWMVAQLKSAKENRLSPTSASWLIEDAEAKTSLRTKVASANGGSVNGDMICRLGLKLPSILRGEAEPLEIMMEDRLLSKYYAEAMKWSRSNAQAGELVRLSAHKNPRLNILEIGGGTGGCTEMVLRALGEGIKPVGRYDFTDISPGFFEAARDRFSRWQDIMTFSTLDIEQDPATQGFKHDSYDVIVACQVLHATTNIQRTLSNVRKLLKTGGKLIMVETTNDQLDLFFTFGLLPGWWLSDEAERQLRCTPSLSPAMWHNMLRAVGFDGGVEFEVRDCDDIEFYMISTMMSTATAETADAVPDTRISDVVVLHNNIPPPSDFLKDLQSAISSKTGLRTSTEPFGKSNVAGKACVFLVDMEQSILADIDKKSFEHLKSMLRNCGSVLWVTRGASFASEDPWKALHIGLLRTLRTEYGEKRYVSLDLDPSRDPWTSITIDAVCNVFSAGIGQTPRAGDTEYVERKSTIHIPRAFKNPEFNSENKMADVSLTPFQQQNRRLRLDIETPGLLDSLYFREQDSSDEEGEGKPFPLGWVEIAPDTFGLNFRDVMVAMGQLETNRVMGFECAGVITKLGDGGEATAVGGQRLRVGDRVCALLEGHWSTRTRTRITNVAHIPDWMTFDQAASIPLAFTTAYTALHATARIRKGEKVLIHGGAGGVGQAAILLSQLAGVEVFATAGTQEKRDFISKKFEISPDHIFSSRDASFADALMARSIGGVDVVLNSLAGNLLQTSFDCLKEFGRFVEIGKRDLEQNSRLSMLAFSRNVSFSSIDLLSWQRAKGGEIADALQNIMDLFVKRRISLIEPISVYPLTDIETAFRKMQGGQHIGKIVVSVANGVSVPLRKANQRLKLDLDASYLVVGGLGGIGRRISEWLVDHGARHLLLLSRSAKANSFVGSLEKRGCKVSTHSVDVSDKAQLTEAIRACQESGMPRIRGVIQGAMVLNDALFSHMTVDEFNAALRPKVHGSWNLHEALGDLDFFIMLSSLVGVMGGAGQANYAAASSFQDALAHHRRSQGKPAVTIDLGMVQSIGYVAEAGDDVAERLARMGYEALHEEDVMAVLEKAILTHFAHTSYPESPLPASIVTGINTSPGDHWTEADWIQEKRFLGLKHRDALYAGQGTVSPHQGSSKDLRVELSRASSHSDVTTIVLEAMIGKLIKMFGLAESDMSSSRSLASMGVDSLVAIELRNWIASVLNMEVSVFELMQGGTVTDLAEVVAKKHSRVKEP